MNMKKTTIALALGGLILLATPLSSAFADEKHNEMKEMQIGDSMQQIKDELRGYVEGVKNHDTQKMQQHLNALLKLSELPAMDHSTMNHSTMDHSTMDHSEMAMNHADMANKAMPAMDHSTMDHSTMDHGDMEMNHADMKMDSADHDMSTMPGMEGMSPAQHQHMMYMQGIAGLNDLFKQLGKTQDKTEIKLILGKIKEQIKKNQQLFS